MELLSKAWAAVSTPKFPSGVFDERPIQPDISDTILAETQRHHRQGFLSINKRELGNKGQGVAYNGSEGSRRNSWGTE